MYDSFVSRLVYVSLSSNSCLVSIRSIGAFGLGSLTLPYSFRGIQSESVKDVSGALERPVENMGGAETGCVLGSMNMFDTAIRMTL